MAISTYAELQSAAQNWLDDTSLSSRIVEFITMGESRINADLGNIRMAWTTSTPTATPSSRDLTLPTGFVEPRALYLTTDGEQVYLRPFVVGTTPMRTTDGTPAAWCIVGANIQLDCPCASADTFLFHYRAKWDIATDLTNWLLTNHPEVYMAAMLVEAYDYRDNYEAVARWEGKYNEAKARILANESRATSVAPLTADAALLPQRPFNYVTGE